MAILEYLERVTYCKSAEAMLWGLSDGLMIILRHHLNNVETESDSKVAKYKRHPPPNLPFRVLNEECKVMMRGSGCTLDHTLLEGDELVGKMTKFGADKNTNLVNGTLPSLFPG